MNTIKWWGDKSAKHIYAQFRTAMLPILAEMMPSYELSHFGISHNEHTGEVILKLHLSPFGKVRAKSDNDNLQIAAQEQGKKE